MGYRMLDTDAAVNDRTGQDDIDPSQSNSHLQSNENPTEEDMVFINDESTLSVASLSKKAAQLQVWEKQSCIRKKGKGQGKSDATFVQMRFRKVKVKTVMKCALCKVKFKKPLQFHELLKSTSHITAMGIAGLKLQCDICDRKLKILHKYHDHMDKKTRMIGFSKETFALKFPPSRIRRHMAKLSHIHIFLFK